jgi:hypothetical protein
MEPALSHPRRNAFKNIITAFSKSFQPPNLTKIQHDEKTCYQHCNVTAVVCLGKAKQ